MLVFLIHQHACAVSLLHYRLILIIFVGVVDKKMRKFKVRIRLALTLILFYFKTTLIFLSIYHQTHSA